MPRQSQMQLLSWMAPTSQIRSDRRRTQQQEVIGTAAAYERLGPAACRSSAISRLAAARVAAWQLQGWTARERTALVDKLGHCRCIER